MQRWKIRRWLKLLTALYVVEQLIFGMEDLHQLQRMAVAYESWFGNANTAIVMLVSGGIALAVLAIHSILKGGFARFITIFLLGLPTIGELHHVVETMRMGHYAPGAVTAIPSFICGALFLRELVKEYRASRNGSTPVALKLHLAA